MLNGSGKSRHPCLIPILEERLLIFTIECDVSCGLVRCGLYYVDEQSFYTLFVESFSHERMLNFVKYFFCIY